MKIFRFLIASFVIFLVNQNISAKQVTVIEDKISNLNSLINNKKYDLFEGIKFPDSYSEKKINHFHKLYSIPASDDAITNTCLTVFIEWCNKFVKEKRDYVIFRTPFNVKADRDDDFWEPIDGKFNNFIFRGSELSFDPFYMNVPVNGFFTDKKIVVSISKIEGQTFYTVDLSAVIPYENSYFYIQKNYMFVRTIDFDMFKTKNIQKICDMLGQSIKDHPEVYICDDGVAAESLLFYFHWEFFLSGYNFIKQIHIDPENATINSLFFNQSK